MYVPNAGQSTGSRPGSLPVGQNYLLGVSDDYLLDVASAVDQDADLPADLPGDFGQVAGEFGCAYLCERDPPPVDSLNPRMLAGLETEGVAEYLVDRDIPREYVITC
jgi:hypothetical protein